ncbi:MAG: hypothetical protein ACJ763_00780 [Bdellovibrionia bacterium]
MKKFNQAFVLAIVTLMSASAFAAGAGEKKDSKDCQEVTTKSGDKAQKASNVKAADEEKKDSKAAEAK